MTTVNIDGRAFTRFTVAVIAALIVGVVGYFVGQSTRMSDTAVAGVKNEATAGAIKATKAESAIVLANRVIAVKKAAKRHERKAVRKVRRVTRRNERKRAAKLAEKARSEGVNAGYGSGYGAGNTAGHAAGYDEGSVDGYVEGSDDSFEFCEEDDGTIC
jgi:hypothetical protein